MARDCNGFALGPAPWEALDEARLWGVGCILELDELYTRRVMGFSSVEELYRWASCVESLWRVADLPLLLLNSRDDPLIPEVMHAIPRDYTGGARTRPQTPPTLTAPSLPPSLPPSHPSLPQSTMRMHCLW